MGEEEQARNKQQQAPAEAPPPVPPPVDPPQPPPNPGPEKHDDPKKMTKSEKIMVWATCVIAVGTLVSAGAICFQWYEMHTGGADTKAIACAAEKQVRAANRSADAAQQFADTAALINGGVGDAVKKLDAQAMNTKNLSDESRDANYRELRPYVQFQRLDVVGDIFHGDAIKGTAYAINTGRTPAVSGHGCADIAMLPSGTPMTDKFKCPAPNNPKQQWTGEHSSFDLGSNIPGFGLSSPPTRILPANISSESFKTIVAAGGLRLYFYGAIEYSDLIRPKVIHHTIFCGRYVPDDGTWSVCELHNHAD
jgi:hypothetical protein